jgi:hypothetical protein
MNNGFSRNNAVLVRLAPEIWNMIALEIHIDEHMIIHRLTKNSSCVTLYYQNHFEPFFEKSAPSGKEEG